MTQWLEPLRDTVAGLPLGLGLFWMHCARSPRARVGFLLALRFSSHGVFAWVFLREQGRRGQQQLFLIGFSACLRGTRAHGVIIALPPLSTCFVTFAPPRPAHNKENGRAKIGRRKRWRWKGRKKDKREKKKGDKSLERNVWLCGVWAETLHQRLAAAGKNPFLPF